MAAPPGASASAVGPTQSLVQEAINLNSVKTEDRPSGAEDLFAFHQLRNILKDALQLKAADLLATLRADVDKRLFIGDRWRLTTVAERVMLDRPDGPTRKLGEPISRDQLRGAFTLQPGRYELPETARGTLVGPKPKKIVIRMPAGKPKEGREGGSGGGEKRRRDGGGGGGTSMISGGSDTQDTGMGSRATAATALTARTGATTGTAAGSKRQRSRADTLG